jgi:hypothetical protein
MKNMRTKHFVVILVLLASVLQVSPAFANKGGERPFKAHTLGTMLVSNDTAVGGAIGGTATQSSVFHAAHLGTGIVQATGVDATHVVFDPLLEVYTFDFSVSGLTTAANGDKLEWTSSSGNGTFTSQCLGWAAGCVIHIEVWYDAAEGAQFGGTGRFANATGQIHEIQEIKWFSSDGDTTTLTAETWADGWIDYWRD